MFKKFVIAFDWIALIVVGMFVLTAFTIVGFSILLKETGEDPMEKYMKDKYQVEIEILEKEAINSLNMGDVWNSVALKENANVKFDIHVTGLLFPKVLEDEYHLGLETYEVFKKIEGSLGKIQQLGFTKMEGYNLVEYETYFDIREDKSVKAHQFNVYVSSEKPFTYNEIDKLELDRIYAMITEIKATNDAVSDVYIFYGDKHEVNELVVKDIRRIKSKEELLLNLKRSNNALATYIAYSTLNDRAMELENGRFVFKDFSGGEFWLRCNETDDEGECVEYYISILYEKDGLGKENPYLFEDIRKIGDHFKQELGSSEFTINFQEDRKDLKKYATINSYQIHSDEEIRQFISDM